MMSSRKAYFFTEHNKGISVCHAPTDEETLICYGWGALLSQSIAQDERLSGSLTVEIRVLLVDFPVPLACFRRTSQRRKIGCSRQSC